MTRYHGLGEQNVFVLDEGVGRRSLTKRPDLLDHHPVRFDWGDTAQEPSHLAIALLADAADDETARAHHEQFASEIVSYLPACWTLTREEIVAWIDLQQDDVEAGDERGAVA